MVTPLPPAGFVDGFGVEVGGGVGSVFAAATVAVGFGVTFVCAAGRTGDAVLGTLGTLGTEPVAETAATVAVSDGVGVAFGVGSASGVMLADGGGAAAIGSAFGSSPRILNATSVAPPIKTAAPNAINATSGAFDVGSADDVCHALFVWACGRAPPAIAPAIAPGGAAPIERGALPLPVTAPGRGGCGGSAP